MRGRGQYYPDKKARQTTRKENYRKPPPTGSKVLTKYKQTESSNIQKELYIMTKWGYPRNAKVVSYLKIM